VFAEPVAAACQIAAQITVRPEDRIVVLGDGRLGNLCAQVLSRLSSRVLVVGKYQEKLGLLLSMGIDAASLSDPLDERAADIVVDCTGSETGLSTALKLVRPRGTIVLKTTVAGAQTMAWAPFVIDEVTLVGSRCGPFDQALLALERGHVKVQPLISDRFPLGRGIDALARAQTNPVLKVLLDVS
jgi:threonine dehydrogenase-like Zn-dependent dehydrogenase